MTALNQTRSAPVALNNPNGWGNITRFATMACAKLVEAERRAVTNGCRSLQRAEAMHQRRMMNAALKALFAREDSFKDVQAEAEHMISQLRGLVDEFDNDIKQLVGDIEPAPTTMSDELLSAA